MSELALHGGPGVRSDDPWPEWPIYDADTERSLLGALRSRRWSVSWHSDGSRSRERRFAEEFAAYNGADHCVSVDHGSSALLIALEALDIGPGDEVIVPVLTWVAPVTAVLRVGATPVLVDVDPMTGCMTAQTISDALTPRTMAVILVHLACTVADLDAITALTHDAGIPLIEDCSQAHGSTWRGQRVGTFGRVGVFSLGAAKVLAAGEGGAVLTSSPDLYRRLQMLRADSRRYPTSGPGSGAPELIEDGEVMGANYCMSELTAAVLLDQLPRLDGQHDLRAVRANEMSAALAELGGFDLVPVPKAVERRAVYELGIQFQPGTFGESPIEEVAAALTAELGLDVYPPRVPLNRSRLLRPHTKRRFSGVSEEILKGVTGRSFPGAEHYRAHTLLVHHRALLGKQRDIADIARALEKVQSNYGRRPPR